MVEVSTDEVLSPGWPAGKLMRQSTSRKVISILPMTLHQMFISLGVSYAVGRVTLEAVSGGVERRRVTLKTQLTRTARRTGIQADFLTDYRIRGPFHGSNQSPTRCTSQKAFILARPIMKQPSRSP